MCDAQVELVVEHLKPNAVAAYISALPSTSERELVRRDLDARLAALDDRRVKTCRYVLRGR
jgi:hypothetical protein